MKYFLLTVVSIAISVGICVGQDIILKLNPEKNPVESRNYQFEKAIDSRIDKSLGFLHDAQRNKHILTFGENFEKEVLHFYNSKIKTSSSPSHRILVKIYSLDLEEIYLTDRRAYKGEVELKLGFFLMSEQDPINLVDFSSKFNYTRSSSQSQTIEPSIQKLFDNSWQYFDDWIGSQSLSNRLLAKSIRLNILDPIRASDSDTVFYDPDRPLTWDDFIGPITPRSSYNATIFSSMSIAGNAAIVNGEIVQTIDIKVYMIPDQSWVKDANAYANNHEQRHFDLTRIAADRMIIKLNQMDKEPYLFEATLNDIYLDAYREMNHLQDFYDGQTRNGINKDIQADWDKAISDALKGNYEILESLMEKGN
ncbi:hypothetical protein [uncultured Algoriphagus sp.]|uniref:hypothetical protein n=1 Tax=uncultured Algoriphagus sp. TaxID=417365 RepID=UPI0030ECE7AC|tara:strand:+ start:25351 stop:26445 length:1095 start_codon:yes stop_codon:yes gene_type:complete